jgi:mono/diheme cytochrome c family protein
MLAAPPVTRADPATIYQERCAVCHGAAGRGDGPAAGMLTPPPRDFTSGAYKLRSTPSGALPTAEDVVRTIRRGVPGTSMPAFGDLLAAGAIVGLARHVVAWAPARPVAPALEVPREAPGATVARGARVYADAGCESCHGPDGRGTAWRPPREGLDAPRAPTRLDEPWTFAGGDGERAIALRILTGLDGTAMPAYVDSLTPADALALARFVRSLARAPIWEAREATAVAAAGVAIDSVARGRYLVRAMQCPLCHTPISAETGAYDTARFLAGGMRVSAWPWGVWFSRNLTPDAGTGLGEWTEAEIVAAVTRGVARDGRRLDPMAMPWPWFSRLTPADAGAIATYLRALPPQSNAVPAAMRPSLPERMGGKLLALLGAPAAVEFWGGNAATDPALRHAGPPPGRRAAALAIGWGSLAAAGLVGLALARRRARAWVVVAVPGALVAGWLGVSTWPPLGLMSPETTARWLLSGTPGLPATVRGAERALAERGEYLATIAPCGLCHTPTSPFVGFLTGRTLAGGMQARWRVYGRVVSANLTPHPDGLGDVADAEALRAIASGIRRDGGVMHWQAMPWDILSNWSEEDRRAMLAYLRALPPVAGRVPAPEPPRPDDPPADTFSFGDAARRPGLW